MIDINLMKSYNQIDKQKFCFKRNILLLFNVFIYIERRENMNIMQYEILLSTKGVKNVNGVDHFKDFIVYRDKDGAAIIEGKIMVSSLDAIIQRLRPCLSFVKEYSNLGSNQLTSDELETIKPIITSSEEWEERVIKTPRENLWLASGVLRCPDSESFSVAIDVLRD